MSKKGINEETTNTSRYPLGEGVICAVSVLLFLLWLSRYVTLDFWYDEVTTLNNYVFVPLKRTITDYSSPNNHIFFNLMNNIFLKLSGTEHIFELIDHTYVIRLLPLAYTLATLCYLYLTGKKFFNTFVARLALILLVTTVPYYNFAVQVRGYSLSMMLVCMAIYHLWSLEKRFGWVDTLALALSSLLAIYTIPSNLYVILAMALFSLSAGVAQLMKKGQPNPEKTRGKKMGTVSRWQQFNDYRKDLFIFFVLVMGILLAVFLYLPVMHQLLNDPYIESKGLFDAGVLFGTMPQVFVHFVSQRYLLVPVIFLGLCYCIVSPKKGKKESSREVLFLFMTLLLPFVFSFIRGDQPFDRIFVVLSPLFALLVALTIYFLQSAIPVLRSKTTLITIGVFLYCSLTFASGIEGIKKRLRFDMEIGRKSQDIYYNYYQAYYHPLKVLADFAEKRTRAFPVIVHESDDVALPVYLKKMQIRAYEPQALNPLLRSQRQVYVITSFPNKFEWMMEQNYPRFQTKRINEHLDFHTIFFLERND
jgi:hypothetical protein